MIFLLAFNITPSSTVFVVDYEHVSHSWDCDQAVDCREYGYSSLTFSVFTLQII